MDQTMRLIILPLAFIFCCAMHNAQGKPLDVTLKSNLEYDDIAACFTSTDRFEGAHCTGAIGKVTHHYHYGPKNISFFLDFKTPHGIKISEQCATHYGLRIRCGKKACRYESQVIRTNAASITIKLRTDLNPVTQDKEVYCGWVEND